jgi:hypothetical protein
LFYAIKSIANKAGIFREQIFIKIKKEGVNPTSWILLKRINEDLKTAILSSSELYRENFIKL